MSLILEEKLPPPKPAVAAANCMHQRGTRALHEHDERQHRSQQQECAHQRPVSSPEPRQRECVREPDQSSDEANALGRNVVATLQLFCASATLRHTPEFNITRCNTCRSARIRSPPLERGLHDAASCGELLTRDFASQPFAELSPLLLGRLRVGRGHLGVDGGDRVCVDGAE